VLPAALAGREGLTTNYLGWFDGPAPRGVCGQAAIVDDTRRSDANVNNYGGKLALVYRPARSSAAATWRAVGSAHRQRRPRRVLRLRQRRLLGEPALEKRRSCRRIRTKRGKPVLRCNIAARRTRAGSSR